MEVIHPRLNKPVPVVGVLARELLPKSFDFDVTAARKLCTFTPKGNDAIVNLTPGAAEAIGVVGATVNITYVTGASTVASIAALVAGSPAADALVSVSGDAGTFTTAASVTLDLWEDRPIPPVLAYVLDADGNVVPMPADPPINGPCTLYSATGDNTTFANGTTLLGGGPIPCAMYSRIGVQITWSTVAGTRTFQFRCYGKIDSAAWPAAGSIPAAYQIESAADWHYTTSSTTFGAAAAANGTLVAWFDDPQPFDSIAIEMIVAGTDANNSTVTATYVLYGGKK